MTSQKLTEPESLEQKKTKVKAGNKLEEYTVAMKFNQISSMQLFIANDILRVQEPTMHCYADDPSTRYLHAKTFSYPFNAILTQHVRSIGSRPVFYYEVKFVEYIDISKADSKLK